MVPQPRYELSPVRALELTPGDIIAAVNLRVPRVSLVMWTERNDTDDTVTLSLLDALIGEASNGDADEREVTFDPIDVLGRLTPRNDDEDY